MSNDNVSEATYFQSAVFYLVDRQKDCTQITIVALNDQSGTKNIEHESTLQLYTFTLQSQICVCFALRSIVFQIDLLVCTIYF